MKQGSKQNIAYWIQGIISIAILVYFILSNVPRGDEGDWYKDSFLQAYELWPKLDLSPFWTISSFYLWLVGLSHIALSNFIGSDIITSGRFFSLFCWIVLLYLASRKGGGIKWKLMFLLFNPYVLVYSTRAHPLVPALLLVYLFWIAYEKKQKYWPLFLLFAVNFQVFTGAVSAMLLPSSFKNLSFSKITPAALGVLFAVSGVFVTWITWGGIYPDKFKEGIVYTDYHVSGTISWGYFFITYLLAGGFLWVLGDRPILKVFNMSRANLAFYFSLVLIGIVLLSGKELVTVIDIILRDFLSDNTAMIISTLIYLILGLGLLRVHRDRFILFMGILSSGILLFTLPYYYERLALFGILAPMLIWILRAEEQKEKNRFSSIFVINIVFIILASVYQKFGAL